MQVEIRGLRLFSLMSSSTSWSRLMSSLLRLLRGRHGLPSLPRRARFLEPSSSSSRASPARRRLACSVMAALRMRTSSPRSTSCSLPCIVGRSPNGLVGSDTVGWASGAPDCCSVFDSWLAFSTACRLANSDSMYSSLHDQFVSRAAQGHRSGGGTYICLLTSSPTNPAWGAKRLVTPYSIASAA